MPPPTAYAITERDDDGETGDHEGFAVRFPTPLTPVEDVAAGHG
jgi:hypothetical protein